MEKRHVIGPVLAGALALSASVAAIAAAPAPPAGGLQILDFKPAFDDMMTMLIQPRHIKLYYAGQAQNWPLAAFQLNEMKSGFDRIAQTLPKYRNVDLGPTFISMIGPKIQATNGAIAAKNPKLFADAYLELTNTCNSCHEALDHGFLKIKVPEPAAASNYANQDFRPLPAGK